MGIFKNFQKNGHIAMGIFSKITKKWAYANGHIPKYAHLNLLGNGNIKIKLPHYGNKKENLIVIISNPKFADGWFDSSENQSLL